MDSTLVKDDPNTGVKEGVDQETVDAVREVGGAYKYGWSTDIEMDYAPLGLNADIVKLISEKNEEPEWMTEWRLKAFERWTQMKEPTWAMVDYPKINYQDIIYYSAPKAQKNVESLDEIDPEILKTYEKLGIPLREQEILAIFAERPGETIPRHELVSGDAEVGERTIDVQINRLRRKIERDPGNPVWLQTVRGVGYRLSVE